MAIKKQDFDLIQALEVEFDSLSPQLKNAARYIISAPDEIALYSMREIAGRAKVAPATMVRLADRFGYDTYNKFRDDFRKRIAAPVTGYAARARALRHRQNIVGGSSLGSEMLAAEKENLIGTYQAISNDQLELAAEACLAARKIYVVGLRKCFPIAYFFHYGTRLFFPSSVLVQGQAGLFREEISQIGKEDLVFAVAFEPYTRETVETSEAAREAGATRIVITDSSVSPLAKDAEFVFIASNRSPSFYRSLTGALSIAQALVAAIVSKTGDQAIEALDQMDAKLRSSNTYWYK
ncbi:MurR/RpiR family transcriptional regulator [Sneathiella aquimaris]|uniref:MurR/RpiR family transcriptional regulator n=1 Tax=Sneathiella aquimaris TaxID=2599305 RepID=UPI00146E1905|nr:MurR/RpiR family transcriptional regulator [Sneathiella aquimaris]